MIAGSIQSLKTVEFIFYPHPIALGKVSICYSFLASDIIVECFGKRAALKGALVGYLSNLIFMIIIILTISYMPHETSKHIDNAIKIIFLPMPGIWLAGLIAFMVSQAIDIYFYSFLKNKFPLKKLMPIRSFFSTVAGSFFDNIIFYSLAFYVFNNIVDLHTLFYSFIIGTFIFRVVIIFFSSLVINLITQIIKKSAFYKNKSFF